MKSLSIALPLALSLIPLCEGAFSVSGRQILNNGEPFQVRGLCYQPTPIGADPSAAPPYGDYFTANYSGLIERDLPNMRRMGANVIRVYGWTTGANHTGFLDLAYNNGEDSLYVLINKWINPWINWNDAGAVNALKSDWAAMAAAVKDHPAVMGFLVGNEVDAQNNNLNNSAFWQAMNAIAGAVKAAAPNLLVSTAITDQLPYVSSRDAMMTNLDFWAIQVYRGVSFYNFFTQYAAASEKPLIITEFGFDAYEHNAQREWPDNAAFPADVMETLWSEIRASDVCSGGCVFEYADEWWKVAGGSPSVHDTSGWTSPAWPDGAGNEEWWGIFRVIDNGSAPDIMEPRAMFYRLAAMWNAPELTYTAGSLETSNLKVAFSYPADLRDQLITVSQSSDLQTWETVADNSSGVLLSKNPGVSVQIVESDNRIEATVTRSAQNQDPVFLRTSNAGR